MTRASHLKRDILLAALGGGILLSMLELVSLMVFGPILTQHGFYISYSLAQKINIGNFFERIEALMAISWLISTYFKSILYMFGFVLGIAQLFELKGYKPLILPSALLMFASAVLIGPNIVFYTNTVMPAWLDWNVTVSLIIPLFLLLVHRLRFQRKKQSAKRLTS
ncbi:GerAB/ArcD/ProY family transporter [Paenibacillus illinoisensis]|uniref:GerAB/ArcD/ProY family transporter n=1 Tax=Paenibacillus illinoisensis TaxID=59845 RepID=UPI00215EBA98|nr:GerAB/ArcD/ProY family transporter [Paenibacillus illinoisensis]